MSDTEAPLAVRKIDRDWIGYKVGRAPKQLASAAVWAAREGLVSSADVPDAPAQDVSRDDYLRYAATLHKALEPSARIGRT
jgi:hypothetical protein